MVNAQTPANQAAVSNIEPNLSSKPAKSNKFLIFIIIILSLIIVFVAGALTFWYFSNRFQLQKKEAVFSPSPQSSASVSQIIPQASSENTAAPSFLPSPAASTLSGPSDETLIKQAMASRHSKSIGDTEISCNILRPPYASGTVRFAGEIGGGWFLAYKQGGNWIIVDDGNGTISCQTIAPYNFPKDIVPECWDETSGSLINR